MLIKLINIFSLPEDFHLDVFFDPSFSQIEDSKEKWWLRPPSDLPFDGSICHFHTGNYFS
jgi:hypothetical protein